MALKFLKWVEIIKAESEAVKRNAMYVLQKDAETCDVIFIDSKGRKRKASGLTLPQIENQLARIDAANIDAVAQEQWRNVLSLYTKAEVDDIAEGLTQAISDEQQARTIADEDLQQSLSDETTARQSADTTLQQNIDTETQARIAGDNNLAQNHSDLQAIVNALQTWKDAMTNADADNLVNTLNEILTVMANVPEGTNIYAVLASKVNTADIVNNLTSSLTNAPLSAYQGSVLKGLIDGLQTSFSLHSTNPNNPHSVTKSQVGLSNVDNTSDADKPVSTQQQLVFDAKIDKGSLVSNDESIFIDGVNLEGMLSLYKEEFSTQNKNLDFKPINFIGVYKNGLFLSVDDYTYTTPRAFSINEFQSGDKIIVQYQHLKTDTLL